MRLEELCLMALIPFAVASTPSEDLYNNAMSILHDVPQFSYNKQVNSDNRIILNIPVDYSVAYDTLRKKEIRANLTAECVEAYSLLEQAAQLGSIDASYVLADINMYGNYSYPTNPSLALEYYKQVVEATANATAYFNIAFIYSTGLFGAVPIDQGRANVYYDFAFQQGSLSAGLVLGYRYLQSIGVSYDCAKAEFYYQSVADELKQVYDNGPLGGLTLDSYALRLGDFKGGVYGKGVSDMKSSLTRKSNRYDYLLSGSFAGDENPLFDSLYWLLLNEYEGSYLKKRNFPKARQYAEELLERAGLEGHLIDSDKKYTASASMLLAKMYLRGEGTAVNITRAIELLDKSLNFYPMAETKNYLGLIYEFVPEYQDIEMAKKYYSKAISIPSGHYNYGRHLLSANNATGEIYISSAAKYNELNAIYHLADINVSHDMACEKSISLLKQYCERFSPLYTSLEWALFELIHERPENSLLGYAMAAEMGIESAQASAAYLLHQLSNLFEDPPINTKERQEMAAVYLTRSACAGNSESAVVLGDLYYSMLEPAKASAAYDMGATRGSAQAHFNLAWLYESGKLGERDLALAKRHYDLALSYDPKTYLVVKIALLRLQWMGFWENITGKKINDIREGPIDDDPKKKWKWREMYFNVRHPDHRTDHQPLDRVDEGEIDADGVQVEDDIFGEETFLSAFWMVVIGIVVFGLAGILNQVRLQMGERDGRAQQRVMAGLGRRIL